MTLSITKITPERPDLYIGLVCPAGTDLTEIKSQLQAQLKVVQYQYEEIKVSTLIKDLLEVAPEDDEFARIKTLMDCGDKMRAASPNGDGVAAAIIAELRRRRGESDGPTSTAYVIDSLKNPKELDLLDQIYGRNYYSISIFKPVQNRLDNLSRKIAETRREPLSENHKELATELIDDDEQRKGKKAQNVRDSFPKAEFFIDGTKEVSVQIQRFIKLIFKEPFTTPTLDEFNMFVAKASALRSSDLSRIVGAVIAHPKQGLIATGCNEVPYPGGGIFYEGRADGLGDNRDHMEGHDPNYLEIQRTIIEFVEALIGVGHVNTNMSASELADELLHGDHKELSKGLRIRNLIEFGRVVHAEMHAITQAALAGRSVAGSSLYCTTFPCHGCARHIIAAGIAEVIFIEPYPKSLTGKLYEKEIEMCNEPVSDDDRERFIRVRFRPFHGVAPALYQRVFAMRDRKNDRGTIATWNPKSAIPVGAIFGVERPKVETAVSNSLADVLEKLSVKKRPSLSGEMTNEQGNSEGSNQS